MIKILYANGCSMVEGCELGNVKFNYDEKTFGHITSRGKFYNLPQAHIDHMETHNWSYHLKEQLSIDGYKNSGRPGSCNNRIVRTTIIDVLELLTQFKTEEIFVVIGWSGINRFEFLTPFGTHYQFVPGFRTRSSHLLHPKIIELSDIYETYIAHNLLQNQINHFLNILEVQNFLNNLGIKFMFSYGTYEHAYSRKEIDEVIDHQAIKLLFNSLDNSKLILNDAGVDYSLNDRVEHMHKGSFDYFSTSNKYPIGNGKHPLEEAHLGWATFLYNQMLEQKIL